MTTDALPQGDRKGACGAPGRHCPGPAYRCPGTCPAWGRPAACCSGWSPPPGTAGQQNCDGAPGSSPFPEEAYLPCCLWSSESPGPCERAPPPLSTHQAVANQQRQGRQGPWGHRAHSLAACDTARPRPPPCHGHTADLCWSLPLLLRGPPKPAPFSEVSPFTPQTHLSTFSMSGAGVLGSRYEGSPSPPEPESSKRG